MSVTSVRLGRDGGENLPFMRYWDVNFMPIDTLSKPRKDAVRLIGVRHKNSPGSAKSKTQKIQWRGLGVQSEDFKEEHFIAHE